MEGRLCITIDENVLDWKTENMAYPAAREVCKRVALFIRMTDMGLDTRLVVSDTGNMIVLEHEWTGEQPKVCAVLLHETGAIQVAVSGTSLFQATYLCDEVVRQIEQEIFNSEPTD